MDLDRIHQRTEQALAKWDKRAAKKRKHKTLGCFRVKRLKRKMQKG